jgi:predicted nucleic acid-binding protein
MSAPKIYLETTIFNFPFADDAPQYKADSKKLFKLIKAGKFKPYTSEYAIDELNLTTQEDKRTEMKALIGEYHIELLPTNDEIKRLAALYIAEGAVKASYPTDALHIAITAVYGLDFIVSMNFQHIVKRKTIEETERINNREGYSRIGIYFPAEVIYDENS